VRIGAVGHAAAKFINYATLKVYAGAPQGLTETHKQQFNADLPANLPAA
jgi:non-heme chloroperoxidase